MLRLVHPPPDAGQGTALPKRRKGSRSAALRLTDDEVRHVRAALCNVAAAYGGADVLASAMGLRTEILYKAKRRRPGAALVIRLAAAAGMSVEAILTGILTPAGRCPACGTRTGDRPERGVRLVGEGGAA